MRHPATGNLIVRNRIGTDGADPTAIGTATTAIRNNGNVDPIQLDGIYIDNASNNIIGGSAPMETSFLETVWQASNFLARVPGETQSWATRSGSTRTGSWYCSMDLPDSRSGSLSTQLPPPTRSPARIQALAIWDRRMSI